MRANTIVKLAQDYHQSGILNNLEAFFGNNGTDLINKGTGALSSLFGSKSDTLTNLVANYSGIKSSSSGTLLSMALPVVLGLLGRHAVNSPAGSSSIATVLSHQPQHVANVTPSGFNLGSVFSNAGPKIVNTVKDTSATTARYAENAANDTGSALKWLLPLLILALIAAAAWYFLKDGCNKKTADVVVNADSTINANADSLKNNITATLGKVDSLTGDFIYNEGDTVTVDLPNNAGKLTIGKNSTEYRLINFLNDKNAVLDTVKGNWFEFTNVHFKSGTSTLTDGSMAQLKNIATIFKAFPAAQFKLGGYTDSTGDAALNETLSQKRADLVSETIKKLGSPATSIVSAKGYGKECYQ